MVSWSVLWFVMQRSNGALIHRCVELKFPKSFSLQLVSFRVILSMSRFPWWGICFRYTIICSWVQSTDKAVKISNIRLMDRAITKLIRLLDRAISTLIRLLDRAISTLVNIFTREHTYVRQGHHTCYMTTADSPQILSSVHCQ